MFILLLPEHLVSTALVIAEGGGGLLLEDERRENNQWPGMSPVFNPAARYARGVLSLIAGRKHFSDTFCSFLSCLH